VLAMPTQNLDGVWADAASTGALAGVRVVDLGQYIAGPLAVTLLADQGASVIRINPPGGPRLNAPANALLHRRRRTIELDLRDPLDLRRARALIASADVVVENFRPGVADRLGVGPQLSCARSQRLVYCSLPGFGATDPRASQSGWEGVVMAAAGAYASDLALAMVPGAADVPTKSQLSNLPLASVFGAIEGALGVVSALVARDRDGSGQWLEVPLFDALFEAIGNRGLTFERNQPTQTHFGSAFYRCADGRCVVFMVGFFRHLEWFVAGIGKQDWIDGGLVDYDRLTSDPSAREELRRRLAVVFASRSAAEWEDFGRTQGSPIGMLRSTGEWMATEHAVQSGTLIDVADPDLGRVRVPGPVASLHGLPNGSAAVRGTEAHDLSVVAAIDAALADSGQSDGDVAISLAPESANREPPLTGIRVLDMSRIFAAPTAAKLLAQLGADVIKVDEDPSGLGAAFTMPIAHEHLNLGKRSIMLNLKDPEDFAIFTRLVTEADVVVENWTMGTAERLGVDQASLRRYSPDIIYVYLNANGREGPWSVDRGYADLATVMSGISERTAGSELPPTGSWVLMHTPPWSYTDYAAGVLGAFGAVVALYERTRSGKGRLVETSLLRAAAIEQVLEITGSVDSDGQLAAGLTSTAGQARLNAIANSPRAHSYPTADGRIFVSTPAGRTAPVLRALGIDAEPVPENVVHAMRQALKNWSTADAVDALLRAGAGAHEVVSIERLMRPGGIAEQRGIRIQGSSPRYGKLVMPGPVIRFGRTPMRAGAIPGPFGCDRDEILAAIADPPDSNVGGAPPD